MYIDFNLIKFIPKEIKNKYNSLQFNICDNQVVCLSKKH